MSIDQKAFDVFNAMFKITPTKKPGMYNENELLYAMRAIGFTAALRGGNGWAFKYLMAQSSNVTGFTPRGKKQLLESS